MGDVFTHIYRNNFLPYACIVMDTRRSDITRLNDVDLVLMEVLSFKFRKHSIWKSGSSANSKDRPKKKKPTTPTEKNIDASRRNLCKDSFVEGKELRKPLVNCASKHNKSKVGGSLLEAKTEPKPDQTRLAQDPPSLPDVMVVKVHRKGVVPVTRTSRSTTSLLESDSTSRSRTPECDSDVKASGGSRTVKQRSTSSFARPTLSAEAKQVTAQSRPTSASSTKHATTPCSKKPAKPSVVITGRRLQFSDKKRRF